LSEEREFRAATRDDWREWLLLAAVLLNVIWQVVDWLW
jgi:hypothetical protein